MLKIPFPCLRLSAPPQVDVAALDTDATQALKSKVEETPAFKEAVEASWTPPTDIFDAVDENIPAACKQSLMCNPAEPYGAFWRLKAFTGTRNSWSEVLRHSEQLRKKNELKEQNNRSKGKKKVKGRRVKGKKVRKGKSKPSKNVSPKRQRLRRLSSGEAHAVELDGDGTEASGEKGRSGKGSKRRGSDAEAAPGKTKSKRARNASTKAASKSETKPRKKRSRKAQEDAEPVENDEKTPNEGAGENEEEHPVQTETAEVGTRRFRL